MIDKKTKINKTAKKRTSKQNNSVKKDITKIAELEKNLKLNIQENEKLKDKNVRLLAEFDNFKRRSQDEKNKLYLYAGEDLIKAILPILDDLNRSLESKNINSKTIIKGIELITNNLSKILEENGILEFRSIGEKFNPEIHEAVMNQKSNKQEGTILNEYQKGYKYHEKIIRHAKVVVSK